MVVMTLDMSICMSGGSEISVNTPNCRQASCTAKNSLNLDKLKKMPSRAWAFPAKVALVPTASSTNAAPGGEEAGGIPNPIAAWGMGSSTLLGSVVGALLEPVLRPDATGPVVRDCAALLKHAAVYLAVTLIALPTGANLGLLANQQPQKLMLIAGQKVAAVRRWNGCRT